MYTIAVGNAFDGISLHGIFEDAAQANEVAESKFDNDEWVVVSIIQIGAIE